MTKEQTRQLAEQFIALNGQEAADQIAAWAERVRNDWGP
jgi:hypothetical protein